MTEKQSNNVQSGLQALLWKSMSIFTLLLVPSAAFAQTSQLFRRNVGEGNTADLVSDATGLGAESPTSIIGQGINVFLGFLIIVFTIIIIYAGFKWLTAGGNEEVVQGARKTLTAGAIGLIIVLSAWGISLFLFAQFGQATGTTFS